MWKYKKADPLGATFFHPLPQPVTTNFTNATSSFRSVSRFLFITTNLQRFQVFAFATNFHSVLKFSSAIPEFHPIPIFATIITKLFPAFQSAPFIRTAIRYYSIICQNSIHYPKFYLVSHFQPLSPIPPAFPISTWYAQFHPVFRFSLEIKLRPFPTICLNFLGCLTPPIIAIFIQISVHGYQIPPGSLF